MPEYLTLRQIVEYVEIDVGHVLIPISAFGYTYEKLEKMFIESVKFYEQWKPYEKMVPMQITQSGIEIPDAQNIVNIRYNYGNYIKSVPKVDRNLYSFIPSTKTLRSEVNFTGLVTYAATYPMGYLPLKALDIVSLYASEDTLNFNGYAHWKKGTLRVYLDEGVIPESLFTVDVTLDTLTINSAAGSFYKTGQIFNVRTTGVLPAPLLDTTDYYIIKVNNTTIQLAPTRADALASTNIIDLTTLGTGLHFMTHKNFDSTEDLLSYDYFSSMFTVDVVNNYIMNLDNLFVNRLVEDGTIVTFTGAGTLPAPLAFNTKYYVIIVDATTIQLALTPEDALLHTPINLTTTGSGALAIKYKPDPKPEPEDTFIHLYGTLGKIEINTDTLDGTLYNLDGLEGTIKIDLVSKYKCVEGLSLNNYYNDFFMAVFKQKFAGALGRQKATVKLDGLPVDITADELIALQAEMSEIVKGYTESRGDWWKFA